MAEAAIHLAELTAHLRLKFYSTQAPSNETIQNLVSNIATKYSPSLSGGERHTPDCLWSEHGPARSTIEISNVSVSRPAISDERVIIEGPQSTPRVTTECLRVARRIGDIYQTSQLHSLIPNRGPMGRILVCHLQIPQIKNRDRAKENASRGHSFSNAHSKSMFSSVTNAVDA
jgi:hypothetical protein